MVKVFSLLGPDKENLDRSDVSLSAGFESPTVKLVCVVGGRSVEEWGCEYIVNSPSLDSFLQF